MTMLEKDSSMPGRLENTNTPEMRMREEIIKLAKESGFDEEQWAAMTYDAGPYEITTPKAALMRFYQAAVLVGAEKVKEEAASVVENTARYSSNPKSIHYLTPEARKEQGKVIRAIDVKKLLEG